MKKVWKLRTKLLLSMTLTLIAVMGLFSFYNIKTDLKTFRDQAVEFRSSEMQRMEEILQDQVNTAMQMAQGYHENSVNRDFLIERYGSSLINTIDIAESSIEGLMEQYERGLISLQSAQNQAAALLSNIRFDNGTGYIWINDMGDPIPSMVMHPTAPQLNGLLMDDPKYNCAYGTDKNLFQAFREVCLDEGEGFVDYQWPKPLGNGLSEDRGKLSYVRVIEQWDWVIGTGVYVDDALADAQQSAMENIARLRYDNGSGYFWINDSGTPIPRMIMHPISPQLNGNVMDDEKFNREEGTGENIFRRFRELALEQGQGFVHYSWPKPTEDGLTEDQPKISYVAYFEPWDWIIGTGAYVNDIEKALAMKEQAMLTDIRRSLAFTLLILLGALVLGIMSSLFISLSATRPLGGEPHEIRDVAQSVSNGFLKESHGELGKLRGVFKDLHLMSQRLSAIVSTIKGATDENAANSEELSASAEELASLVEEQAAMAEQVNQTVEAMADSIQDNAHYSRDTEEAVYHMVKSLDDAQEILTKNVEINRQVLEKVEVINQVSRETNMLSLNASIEAARAQEAGKGFSIVAQEVRKLSEHSHKAAEEINELTQCSFQKTGEASSFCKEIQNESRSLLEKMEKINSNCRNEQDRMTEISRAIEEFTRAIEQESAASEQLASMAESLNSRTTQVNDQMSFFKTEEDSSGWLGESEASLKKNRPSA